MKKKPILSVPPCSALWFKTNRDRPIAMKMCATDVVPLVQQGSVEGSGLYEELSANGTVLRPNLQFRNKLYVIFCRNA